MRIIEPGKELPKSFITTCDKGLGRGCGAVLEVSVDDCFQCPYAESHFSDEPLAGGRYLSFYCESCGLILTPDYERIEESKYNSMGDDFKPIFAVKTKDNCPPWSSAGFPTFKEFNEKHNIKWGIR